MNIFAFNGWCWSTELRTILSIWVFVDGIVRRYNCKLIGNGKLLRKNFDDKRFERKREKKTYLSNFFTALPCVRETLTLFTWRSTSPGIGRDIGAETPLVDFTSPIVQGKPDENWISSRSLISTWMKTNDFFSFYLLTQKLILKFTLTTKPLVCVETFECEDFVFIGNAEEVFSTFNVIRLCRPIDSGRRQYHLYFNVV